MRYVMQNNNTSESYVDKSSNYTQEHFFKITYIVYTNDFYISCLIPAANKLHRLAWNGIRTTYAVNGGGVGENYPHSLLTLL